MQNLLSGLKVLRVMDSQAAGTTDLNGDSVDLAQDGGYQNVVFIAVLGTLTVNQVTELKAQGSDDDGSSDAWADLESTKIGPAADDDDDQMLVLEVPRPQERYIRPVLLRETANAEVDAIIALLWNGREMPVSQDTAHVIASAIVASPDEGTA